MKIGTKSVLFGAHQFLIHPIVLAIAWWQLYRFKRVKIGEVRVYRELIFGMSGGNVDLPVYASLLNWRLWLAFFVHDIGYWGMPNMDGPEGEEHPFVGAWILRRVAGREVKLVWYEFVLYHSRFLAKKYNAKPSVLCIADKQALVIEPWWLYLPRVNLSGEIIEYMAIAANREGKYFGENKQLHSQRAWCLSMKDYVRRWVEEHKDGRVDTWTGAGA
jgi:hypothetical protein